MPPNGVLNIKEFAERCRRSPETVRRWYRQGKLPGAKKPGGCTSRLEIPVRLLGRFMPRGKA